MYRLAGGEVQKIRSFSEDCELDAGGLPTDVMPAVNQPVSGIIGYHIRSGKHDVTDYDWEQYLAFADKHLR